MQVDVVDAIEGLAGQTRRVVVVDVAVGRIEQVEHIDDDLHILGEFLPALQVDQARRARRHRVVFDQRTRAEVA